MSTKKQRKDAVRAALREAPHARAWSISEQPWDDAHSAVIRGPSGKAIALVHDPDDARAILACVKYAAEDVEER